MNTYKPSEILAAILRIVYPKSFGGSIATIHQIFYNLQKRNSELMSEFKFLKRINPFCSTLDELLTWFQLLGILQITDKKGLIFQINQEKLKKLPVNKDLLSFLKKEGELQQLCV